MSACSRKEADDAAVGPLALTVQPFERKTRSVSSRRRRVAVGALPPVRRFQGGVPKTTAHCAVVGLRAPGSNWPGIFAKNPSIKSFDGVASRADA